MVKEFVTERLKLIDLYPDKAREVAKEYGLKEEEVELIRKGRVSSEPVIDRDARTVINYISTDAIDRDNEVIEHRGVVLDDYVKNPIVPWAHDYRGLPIGKNLWIKPDKKGLVAKTYFLKHDFAEDVFDLYTEDIKGTGPALNAWSVGFIPLKWKDAKPDEKVAENERPQTVRRTYKKWMLLEYSAVPVPSNPEALTLMVEKGLIKNDKLKKDIEDFITETKEKTDQELTDEMFENKKDGKIRFEEEAENTCKELVLKPEETDDFIRIPVRDCKVTATITISAGQGITALYCGKIKKIRTYIFSKKEPYNWTMKKALAWVKEHGKNIKIEVIKAYGKELTFVIEGDKTFEFIPPEKKVEEKETEEETKTEDPIKWIKELTEEVKALKEGRVLSGKNLKLVKDCAEQIAKVGELLNKLIVASESPKEESILPLIEESKGKENITDINSLTKDDVPVIVEETLKGFLEAMSGQHKEIQKIFDNKRGKVN